MVGEICYFDVCTENENINYCIPELNQIVDNVVILYKNERVENEIFNNILSDNINEIGENVVYYYLENDQYEVKSAVCFIFCTDGLHAQYLNFVICQKIYRNPE